MQKNEAMSKTEAIKWHAEKIIELNAAIDTPTDPEMLTSPLAHLDFLESLEGKNENDDFLELVGIFRKHGLEPGDIRKDSEAWCGKGLRLAIVAAGRDDPGEKYNRACNWEHFGEEADDPNEPGTIIVYYSHVACRTRDGGEIGCNVGNSVKVMPVGQNWFGNPMAYRKIA